MNPDPIPSTPWLDHLRRHLPIAEAGQDPEGVHQLRVAAARLRVWLRLDRRSPLDDELRWLRDAAGPVRDLDVLIALGGPPEFLRHLADRWRDARRGLLAALHDPRLAVLLTALAAHPPLPRARAEGRTARWRRRVLSDGSGLDWLEGPEGEVHAFRRRVRRLRYACDWLGIPDERIKDLSERLGKLNDLFVLRDWIARGDLPPAQAPDPTDLTARIAQRREWFGEEWPRLRSLLGPE